MALPEKAVSFQKYERISYSRFALEEVVVDLPQATVRIDRIEAYSPITWLWRAYRRQVEEPFADVGRIQLELKDVQPSAIDDEISGPTNLFEVIDMAKSPLAAASSWVPYLTVVSIEGRIGENAVELRNIVWRESKIEMIANYDQFSEYDLEVMAELVSEGAAISIKSAKAELNLQGRLAMGADSASFLMEVDLKKDHLEAGARFDRSGWLPVDASWRAHEWSIQSSEYGLSGPYTKYGFSINGEWKNGVYRNYLSGKAEPNENGGFALPPLEFEGTVSGSEDQLKIEDFRLSGPGIEARTVEPFGLALGKLELSGEIKFDINFDLALLKFENLKGMLSGDAYVSADDSGTPQGRFSLNGSGVVFENLEAEVLKVEAGLNWPHVGIESLDIVLDTGSRIKIEGSVDVANKIIAPSIVEVDISEKVLEKLTPEGFVVKDVKIAANLEGPFEEIAHSGNLSIGVFEMDVVKPLNASLEWKGQNNDFESFSAGVMNDLAQLSLSGSGAWKTDRIELTLDSLAAEKEGIQLVSLEGSSEITVFKGEKIAGFAKGFSLQGRDKGLRVDTDFSYPEAVDAQVVLQGFDTRDWVDPWMKTPLTRARVDLLEISTSWNNGPIEAKGLVDAAVFIDENEFIMNGEIALNGRTLDLNAFAISDTEGPLLRLEGNFPYGIDPSVEGFLVVDPDALMEFSMETIDSPSIIAILNTMIPIEIEYLQANARLGGTMNMPQGELGLNVLTKAGEGEYGAPSAKINAIAAIDGPNLNIDRMSVQMLKQKFEASLGIRLPQEALKLTSLKTIPVDWSKTRFEFLSPKTSLAPIAFFAPQLLTPSGTFESQFSGSPADGFSGMVSIDGLSTRPVFPFGSFRNIQTIVRLDRTTATLEKFKGDIGREPMSMKGEIDYRNLEDLAFDFTISGEDLPILRQAGLLLRSNLDLVAKKNRGKEAKISGEVTLKEGLFLMDTSALRNSGGGGQSAASRPPYFSVDVPPFAEWGLEVAVKGNRFMRLQTPAANGVLSVDMDLKGTLKEPLAIGRVEFDQGNLIFPFASFGVTEGLIELRVDDPYTPVLSLIGESRRLRYDLGIEILGSAFEPRIRFTSSPPLSSEQILLMVMAGDVPDENFNYTASQRASIIGTYLSQGFLTSGGGEGLGSRFSLVTGQNLSEQGKETLEMEFKLDDQFQLLGEYDEYDAWNAGIRWRAVRRKAKKKSEVEIKEVSK